MFLLIGLVVLEAALLIAVLTVGRKGTPPVGEQQTIRPFRLSRSEAATFHALAQAIENNENVPIWFLPRQCNCELKPREPVA